MSCSAGTPDKDAVKLQFVERYGRAPILFEENRGQAAKGVEFVARGLGRRILIRPSGVDVWAPLRGGRAMEVLSIGFPGANEGARGEAQGAIAGRSGLMWNGEVIALENYQKVRYRDVWPGADIVYYGNGHDLEYDIVLHPGADLKKIKLWFAGVRSLGRNSSGDLLLSAGEREFIQRKPRIYQRIGGRRVDVAGAYRIGRDGRVSFEIPRYDHTQTLVIDPTLVYNNPSLDPTIASASGVAVDNSGNSYVTGATFPVFPGGVFGAYIAKLDPLGNIVGNPFEVGGSSGNTFGNGITVDSFGNIYIVGQTNAAGLINTNTCPNCGFQSTLANSAGGSYDGFLMAFAPSVFSDPTHSVNYVTYMGGASNDVANAVAVASPSAVYVAGNTASVDFPVSQGSFVGQQKAFLVKVDTTHATGPTSKVWAIFAGGTGTDTGAGVAIDASGNAYIVGTTTSPSFSPFSSTGFNTTKGANTDGYLDKIDPTGQNSLYFTYFVNGSAAAIAVVGTTAYVTGQVPAPGNLGNITASAAQPNFGGGNSDGFLFGVQTSQSGGASLAYSTYLGGSGNDIGYGVAADTAGKAYVVGSTSGGFPVKNAIQGAYAGGNRDPFYAVVNTNLSGAGSLLSATYLGSGADDSASAVAVSPTGDAAYISGSVSSGGAFLAKVSEAQPTALRFVPMTPCRVADTRNTPNGPFSGPPLGGGTTRDFIIPNSACNIPSSAAAYSLNVTVVPQGSLGYLTVWPSGQPQPLASTLNSLDGRIKANAAIAAAGTGGAVSVYVTNSTDLVLDIDGYFVPTGTPSSLAFYPLAPCRIADTRQPTGPLGGPSVGGGQSRTFPVLSSTCNVPSSAQAYSLNFTAVPSGPLGYLTAWQTGQAQPLASTLNALTGAITANAAIVPAGTSGSVDVFASNTTHLVIDIDGYFAPPGTGGLSLYNLAPCRVLDSRQPQGSQPFSGEKDVNVTGSGCGAPGTAQAYVLNATVVPPGSLGYLTMWPQGSPQPVVSTLNALDGAITSNMAIVPTTNGSVAAFASNPTHLVLDIFGYFAP